MFKKFVLATALVGSVLATGTSASAADYAQATPAPPPERVTPIGDFSASESPGGYSAVVLHCSGHTVCDSLIRYCAKHGGTYYDNTDRGYKGVCVGSN